MSSSLSRLADNFVKGLHKDKWKDWESDLEYVTAEENALAFTCIDCSKNYKKKFNEILAKIFWNT